MVALFPRVALAAQVASALPRTFSALIADFVLWVGATLYPLVTSVDLAFVLEIIVSFLHAVVLALLITVSVVFPILIAFVS